MQAFSSLVLRRFLFVWLALCLVLEALFAPYEMNADTISYFDLADLIRSHQWHWVVNAYWHPGYPALLLLARTLLRVPLCGELLSARLLNLAIAVLFFLSVRFALHAAVELRQRQETTADWTGWQHIRIETLDVAAAGITMISITRELSPQSVRPDVLVETMMIMGVGFLVRVSARKDLWSFAGVGLFFGLGFLVKSVAFPVFLVALASLPIITTSIKATVRGMLICTLVFAAVAGPYIAALSMQKGRFCVGDSGRLGYAWYVDGADRFEQQKNDPSRYGRARGNLKHTSVQLLAAPPVYFFGTAMPGTEPQWLDPSYWNDGLDPRFDPRAEILVILSGVRIILQSFVMRPQYLLWFGAVAILGGRWKKSDFSARSAGPIFLLALAQIGMYLMVYTEPRYIANAVILVSLALIAFLRVPKGAIKQDAVAMCATMFLGMMLCSSFTDSLKNLKNQQRTEGRAIGAYNHAVFTAAQSLANHPGIRPGDTVACSG